MKATQVGTQRCENDEAAGVEWFYVHLPALVRGVGGTFDSFERALTISLSRSGACILLSRCLWGLNQMLDIYINTSPADTDARGKLLHLHARVVRVISLNQPYLGESIHYALEMRLRDEIDIRSVPSISSIFSLRGTHGRERRRTSLPSSVRVSPPLP